MRGQMPGEAFHGKLSARGQVVIPQALREWAELREGTLLTFNPQPDGSTAERGDALIRTCGTLPGHGTVGMADLWHRREGQHPLDAQPDLIGADSAHPTDLPQTAPCCAAALDRATSSDYNGHEVGS